MKITDTIKYVGVYDGDIDLFEGQYTVPTGVSYNSYIIFDEKIAVMDSVDGRKTGEWLSNVEAALNGKAPDYLVIAHLEPDHSGSIQAIADKYPDMKLIIAHLGSEEHVEAIKSAKHGNIYTDTSGYKSSSNNVVEYAVEQVGSEKIFFGTDTYACGFQMGRIKYARISEKDKENIFYNNAKKNFSRQFKGI